MPNYCNNNITITGPNKIINKIEKIVSEEGSEGNLLQYFYPMPKALEDTTAPLPKDATKEEKAKAKENLKKYGYDNWYDWRCENWSTKWDINEFHGVQVIEIGDDESEISFGFDSEVPISDNIATPPKPETVKSLMHISPEPSSYCKFINTPLPA